MIVGTFAMSPMGGVGEHFCPPIYPFMWAPGIQLRSPGLCQKRFSLQSHLAGPEPPVTPPRCVHVVTRIAFISTILSVVYLDCLVLISCDLLSVYLAWYQGSNLGS